MAIFLLRVALPDRPGALGAVASRIGAVRADVVAVDIVGRGEGRAIDEFVVELADERHVSLLMDEIAEVDGVSVEEVRVIPADTVDRRVSAYETAVAIMGQHSPTAVIQTVAERVSVELDASWVAVIDPERSQITASVGACPAGTWISAYVAGTRWYREEGGLPAADDSSGLEAAAVSANAHAPAGDVAWTSLHAWNLVLVAGRPGRAFGPSDQLHLVGIGRLADARWVDLADSEARHNHPSRQRPVTQMAGSPR